MVSTPSMPVDTPNLAAEARCSVCWKAVNLCLCKEIKPVRCRTRVLVLQHPREARNPLGTARLVSLSLPQSIHRVGLSWRSLSAAVGEQVDPKRWGVLYLGTLRSTEKLPPDQPLIVFNQHWDRVRATTLDGIVLLDGNWKQSKTLWWRNPWLLRLRRVVINPKNRSAYSQVRKQPRKNCLSTIEAAAECLKYLDPKNDPSTDLQTLFQKHLDRCLENSRHSVKH